MESEVERGAGPRQLECQMIRTGDRCYHGSQWEWKGNPDHFFSRRRLLFSPFQLGVDTWKGMTRQHYTPLSLFRRGTCHHDYLWSDGEDILYRLQTSQDDPFTFYCCI